jgi:GR25 family glycosyltransferase involved in LPS biosynthesis
MRLRRRSGPLAGMAASHNPECPIFCVNLARSGARRERMERRLGYHGLLERTRFVEAIPDDSPLVDARLAGLPAEAADRRRRAEAACLASHLLAIRTFLESTPDTVGGAIVCEDDALLHNDWAERFGKVLDNLPEDAPLCSLSYHVASWEGVLWAGRDAGQQNVCTFVPETTWGAVMYWISRRYASTVIGRWDVPFRHLPPSFVSELIIKWSGGYLSYPVLALEDAIDSEIRPYQDVVNWHIPFLAGWGYGNFSACEQGDEMSPMAGRPMARKGTRARHRVKLIADWTASRPLCELWNRQSKGDFAWADIEITPDDDDIDYYAIVNRPTDEREQFRPERTIVFQMEPSAISSTWGAWASPDPRQFLQVRSHDRFPNNGEWHLGLTYDELMAQPIEKSAVLSSVTSSQTSLPGQRLRVEFLKHLEEHGTPIDIYGKDNRQGFAGYRGSLPPHDKRAGILPYRYTFAAENSSEPNYFTEKIIDAILGEALCFYWGCPNVDDYIDPRAFIRLPLEDLAGSRQVVEEAIRDNEWDARIEHIRGEKRRILDEHQFFPTLARVVHGHCLVERLRILVVNPASDSERWTRFVRAADDAIGAFAARFERFTGSHAELRDELANHDGGAPVLVLGDEARFDEGFVGELIEVAGQLADAHAEFDVALLGPATDAQPTAATHRSARLIPAATSMDGESAYIVSAKAMKRLGGKWGAEGDERMLMLRCAPPIVGAVDRLPR